MTFTRFERAEKVLCDLIALRTVNPMGRSYSGRLPVERPVIEYLEQLFAPHEARLQRLACSSTHESLLVSIPGKTDCPGTLLEAHVDTVPADDWSDRAFVPQVRDGRVIGRGACDDKGSLAAMVLSLLELLEIGQLPPQPVFLLAAGDEEHAQSGIRHFLKTQHPSIGRAIFGEPTELVPVIQHKGTIRWDIIAHGRAAHTSWADLGQNAILDIVTVIKELTKHELWLREKHKNPLVGPPSITVTMIEGGRARNIVPDMCKIAVDFRTPPEMDVRLAMVDLLKQLDRLGLSLTQGDIQCMAPALSTDAQNELVRHTIEVCSNELGRSVKATGAPYGCDAGWMPKSVPTIVLGPGSIAQAHSAGEYVESKQLAQAAAIYQHIANFDWNRMS